ncbi:MAG TPA: MarR family transcriptional regulator [Telluria sp.]|nr:MarR family transcriptional regulator [Telluria sp.]
MNLGTEGNAMLDLLNNLMYAVNGSLRADMEGAGIGLAPMEALALDFLQRNPGCTQADFVQHIGRDKAQVARMVKTLIERALVVSLPDEQDRRLNRLWLTQAGQALNRRATQLRGRLAEKMLEGFDAAKRARLARMLERMAQQLGPGEPLPEDG